MTFVYNWRKNTELTLKNIIIRFLKSFKRWKKQSTLNRLFQPKKEKSPYGMSSLWFIKSTTKKRSAKRNWHNKFALPPKTIMLQLIFCFLISNHTHLYLFRLHHLEKVPEFNQSHVVLCVGVSCTLICLKILIL